MSVIETQSLEQLSELIGGDQSALHELIEIFIEEGAEIVDEMKGSVLTQDLDVLRRTAHSLKSSAQDFGATALSQLTAGLESQCKNEWPISASSQAEAISQEFSKAQTELQSYIDRNE